MKHLSLLTLLSIVLFSLFSCGGDPTTDDMEDKIEQLNTSKKELEEKQQELDKALEEL